MAKQSFNEDGTPEIVRKTFDCTVHIGRKKRIIYRPIIPVRKRYEKELVRDQMEKHSITKSEAEILAYQDFSNTLTMNQRFKLLEANR